MDHYEHISQENLKIENRYNVARDRYFRENREARDELESLSAVDSDSIGCAREETLERHRREIFSRAAQAHDLEMDEFVIRLTAESPEQARAWRLDRHRHVANILGIEWDSYKTLNAIIE